ncbi:hypothetical protein A4V01_21915 [Erysipelotrichaceae bacterium I46]|nr:hypothetical protein A4V01_21915 [Erysipelotrichaceae bacterium I46]ASU19646.1 hypothetical protein ADH65_14635 [[Clostridium] innocuum]
MFAKGRLQLLLINTIVLKSLCFIFTHNRERTLRYSSFLLFIRPLFIFYQYERRVTYFFVDS